MIRFRNFSILTRLEHTLFGLPFIMIGALLPFCDQKFVMNLNPKVWVSCLFVLPAFVAARISGMAFNQYLDRDIDALNPRTKLRPIAGGSVPPKTGLKIACVSLAFFLLFTLCIHSLCFYISCFSAALIVLYSFMKRIHYTCHFVLGMIHFLGPVTAFVAIKHTIEMPIILVGCATFFLNASNDILYALQDFAFDCKEKLHSVPSYFGVAKSVKIAAFLQGLCVISLLLFGIASNFFWIYYLAPCVAVLSFFLFHKKWKTEPAFFFTAQVTIGMTTAISTLMACVWRALL